MKYLYIIGLIFILYSCNNKPAVQAPDLRSIKQEYKEPLMDWNKEKLKDQEFVISKYAERRNWEMTRTETGLYYQIYKEGNGEVADSGMYATYDFEIHLLNGDYCYSSDSIGSRTLELGKAPIQRGLDEALLKMKVGDKAYVILPPHLAYGLPGDGNKIPRDAILVYNLELKNLK